MPQRKIDVGPALLGLGGLLVLIGLFADWYGTASAWAVFETLDLVLAGLAIGAMAIAAGRIDAPGTIIAVALLVIVAVQLIDPPPVVPDGIDLGTGAWLALAGSILAVAGSLMRIARFSVVVDVQGRERRVVATTGASAPAPTAEAPADEAPTTTAARGRRGSLLDDAPVPAPAVEPDPGEPTPPAARRRVPAVDRRAERERDRPATGTADDPQPTQAMPAIELE